MSSRSSASCWPVRKPQGNEYSLHSQNHFALQSFAFSIIIHVPVNNKLSSRGPFWIGSVRVGTEHAAVLMLGGWWHVVLGSEDVNVSTRCQVKEFALGFSVGRSKDISQ